MAQKKNSESSKSNKINMPMKKVMNPPKGMPGSSGTSKKKGK